MIRAVVVLAVLLGVSACEYSSRTRVAATPPAPAPASSVVIQDSLGGVGRQP